MKDYIEMTTKERVADCEAFDYAMDKLGLTMEENNDIEQLEFKEALVNWYFSGNWITEEVKEE